MRLLLIALAALMLAGPAYSHEWYSHKYDQRSGYLCCGGKDCHEILWSQIELEDDGYRIRLTLAEAQVINPEAKFPIDALVVWERAQPSQDLSFHICIYPNDRKPPGNGVSCFFAPPST